MRLLGIDYGNKRVGLARSDEEGRFALPLIVLKNSKGLIKEIIEIAQKNNVREIVLGESRNYKGQANAIFSESLNFKVNLEKRGFVVFFEPEFMTSANAERFQGKNNMLDASAAALILQSYLDRKNSDNK